MREPSVGCESLGESDDEKRIWKNEKKTTSTTFVSPASSSSSRCNAICVTIFSDVECSSALLLHDLNPTLASFHEADQGEEKKRLHLEIV